MTTIDFNRELLPICRCIKITPLVNTVGVLGFTDMDFDIVVDGVTYNSTPGFDVSASDQSVDLSATNAEIRALVADSDFNPKTIEYGFFDNALVEIFILDYQDLAQTPKILGAGELGQTKVTDTEYKLEMRGLEARLDKSRTVKVSPFCPLIFGSEACGFDLSSSTLVSSIVATDDLYTLQISDVPTFGATLGLVKFTTGELNGLTFDILRQSGDTITLFSKLPELPQIGDFVTVVAGCQKTEDACKGHNNYESFGNVPVGGNWVKGRDNLYNPEIDRA